MSREAGAPREGQMLESDCSLPVTEVALCCTVTWRGGVTPRRGSRRGAQGGFPKTPVPSSELELR